MKKRILYFSAIAFVSFLLFLLFTNSEHPELKESKTLRLNIKGKLVNKPAMRNQKIQNNMTKTITIEEERSCLTGKLFIETLENQKLHAESYGDYSGNNSTKEMPQYWLYTNDELEQMSLIGDSEATFFLGIKLLYQSFGINNTNNFFNLPYGILQNEKMIILSFGDDISGGGIELKFIEQHTLAKSRELLYRAAVDGKIYAMFWRVKSYDMERAYYEQKNEADLTILKALNRSRLIDYALLQAPFDSKFGVLDLRPNHLNEQDENINQSFSKAITLFNVDRNNKGYSPLVLNSYPVEWDELEICD